MKLIKSIQHSRFAQALFLLGLTVAAAFAQSGDISASTANVTTLGVTILKLALALCVLACVGVIIWGAVTLGTNRPRGLAMVGGGLFGALIIGLSYALVATTTGASVPTSMILFSFPALG